MMILLDTDVLIDCLRGTVPARNWLSEHTAESFVVPGIVAMELLAGCRDQSDLRRTQSFLHNFSIVWPDASEFARAYDLMAEYRLKSALSIPDYLIAAMTLSRLARLYTFNSKHFRSISELDMQEPYARA